ncbi:MAG: ABC transporter ATP-binding protein [Treponema sp.]|nr:MAG: ABC transporter ATP-binding protein [Treponema sp.]
MSGIKIENITLGYEKNIIFNGFDLKLKKNKVTSIIGANGCGKSTLLMSIARILKPQKGEIYISDKNVFSSNTKEVAKELALLPQSPSAPLSLTVEELVSYGRFPHKNGFGILNSEDQHKIELALKETNLIDFRDREIGSLSGGQRQRAWVALAFAQDSDTILLDEPTTYLDLSFQIEVLEILKKLNRQSNKTIIMVLHDINLACKYSDYIIGLKNGKVIIYDEPKKAVTVETVKQMYSVDAQIIINEKNDKPVCIDFDL